MPLVSGSILIRNKQQQEEESSKPTETQQPAQNPEAAKQQVMAQVTQQARPTQYVLPSGFGSTYNMRDVSTWIRENQGTINQGPQFGTNYNMRDVANVILVRSLTEQQQQQASQRSKFDLGIFISRGLDWWQTGGLTPVQQQRADILSRTIGLPKPRTPAETASGIVAGVGVMVAPQIVVPAILVGEGLNVGIKSATATVPKTTVIKTSSPEQTTTITKTEDVWSPHLVFPSSGEVLIVAGQSTIFALATSGFMSASGLVSAKGLTGVLGRTAVNVGIGAGSGYVLSGGRVEGAAWGAGLGLTMSLVGEGLARIPAVQRAGATLREKFSSYQPEAEPPNISELPTIPTTDKYSEQAALVNKVEPRETFLFNRQGELIDQVTLDTDIVIKQTQIAETNMNPLENILETKSVRAAEMFGTDNTMLYGRSLAPEQFYEKAPTRLPTEFYTKAWLGDTEGAVPLGVRSSDLAYQQTPLGSGYDKPLGFAARQVPVVEFSQEVGYTEPLSFNTKPYSTPYASSELGGKLPKTGTQDVGFIKGNFPDASQFSDSTVASIATMKPTINPVDSSPLSPSNIGANTPSAITETVTLKPAPLRLDGVEQIMENMRTGQMPDTSRAVASPSFRMPSVAVNIGRVQQDETVFEQLSYPQGRPTPQSPSIARNVMLSFNDGRVATKPNVASSMPEFAKPKVDLGLVPELVRRGSSVSLETNTFLSSELRHDLSSQVALRFGQSTSNRNVQVTTTRNEYAYPSRNDYKNDFMRNWNYPNEIKLNHPSMMIGSDVLFGLSGKHGRKYKTSTPKQVARMFLNG